MAEPGKNKRPLVILSRSGSEVTYRLPRGSSYGWAVLLMGIFTVSLLTWILVQENFEVFNPAKLGESGFWLAFYMIALIFIVIGFRLTFISSTLALSSDKIVLRNYIGPFGRSHQLPTRDLQSATLKEFYTQNYEPVRGLVLRSGRKKLRFGSNIPEAQLESLREEILSFARAHGAAPER